MNSFPDAHGASRRAWLQWTEHDLVPTQSDFEKTPIWRLTFLAALIVITINVLSPDPQTVEVPVIATRSMV